MTSINIGREDIRYKLKARLRFLIERGKEEKEM